MHIPSLNVIKCGETNFPTLYPAFIKQLFSISLTLPLPFVPAMCMHFSFLCGLSNFSIIYSIASRVGSFVNLSKCDKYSSISIILSLKFIFGFIFYQIFRRYTIVILLIFQVSKYSVICLSSCYYYICFCIYYSR